MDNLASPISDIPQKKQTASPYQDLPQILVNQPVTAAAMLDAVSLFELVGSKWMLALPQDRWDDDIHEHCFDEVRHTKMVQDGAKSLRWVMSPEDVLKENKLNEVFYNATEHYLSQLSRRIFRLTNKNRSRDKDFSISSYAIMSFLIERRIMKVYPSLARFGPTEEIRQLAKTIIHDERKHLHFVGEKLDSGLEQISKDQKEMIEIEEALASTWMEVMENAARAI